MARRWVAAPNKEFDSPHDLMRKKVLSLTEKDFEIHTFSTSGAGGQRRDRKATGVRIVHPASGVSASCSDTRSQHQNKMRAFKALTSDPRFRYWLDLEVRGVESVEKWMKNNFTSENIKVEVKSKGKWVASEPVTKQELRNC